jgi:putative hemolysin
MFIVPLLRSLARTLRAHTVAASCRVPYRQHPGDPGGTMTVLALEIIFIAVLIVINGVFSMSEIAVLTSRRHMLAREARHGNPRARLVLDLAGHPERFLSSVQVGITLVGILTGVFSGATISELLSTRIAEAYGVAPEIAETVAVFATVAVVTYLTLIFGELLPKKIAMANPGASAKAIAPIITFVQAVARPLVFVISWNVRVFARAFGIGEGKSELTEDDVHSVLDEARTRGIIARQEKKMLERVMRFADQRVSAVMTHRSRVVSLDVSEGEGVNAGIIRGAGHSCYPVVDGSADNLIGFVRMKDLHGRGLDEKSIREVLQEPIFIQESFSAMLLLDAFRETGNRIAVVIDEYGDIQGLVTPTDVLESLVGEIREDPLEEPDIVMRADGSYLVDAHTPLYDVFDRLGLEMRSDPGLSDFNTISGFIVHHLDDIPRESDVFEYQGYRFEIVDMDGHRLDKILVSPAVKKSSPGVKF